ncbi:HEAT repeat domain-containing protein [Actinoallomurus sp. CA-150999]|uniref:HEAT repeat domain-containing protein n=1 Tax=Actinoallomurus sp. CA-150999 TaxID=3239887 RepID=UPI003D8A375B
MGLFGKNKKLTVAKQTAVPQPHADSDANARVRAVEALGAVRGGGSVGPLLEALRDQNGRVAATAAVSLGDLSIQGERVPLDQFIDILQLLPWQQLEDSGIKYRDDAFPYDAERARQRNLMIGSTDGTYQMRRTNVVYVLRDQAIVILGHGVDATHCTALVRLLRVGHRQAAMVAVRGLAATRSPEAVGPLLECVQSDKFNAGDALFGLLGIPGPRATDALLELFEWLPQEADRRRVATELGARGDQRAIEPLKSYFSRSPGADSREAAIRSIGRIGGPAAVEFLQPLLADPKYRRTAISAAGDLKDQRTVPELLRAFREADDTSAELIPAGEALGKLACREIVPDLCDRIVAEHAKYSADIYDQAAHERMMMAVQALERIGDPRALPTLRKIPSHSVSEDEIQRNRDDGYYTAHLRRLNAQHAALTRAMAALS